MDSEKNFEPKISVVIPMYNTEKYVGECLHSLEVQTFQDFEIIVVDDCSTDNSAEVVKSYMPKFDGRLKLIRTEKNSGGCAIPRNVGMEIAKGKYIFMPDSDDIVIKTCLETFYTVAEEFDADVVHCEKYFVCESEELKGAVLEMKSHQTGKFVKEPVLEPYNLEKKVIDLNDYRYIWNVWTKFFKREFLEKNEIKFADTVNNEDVVFTVYCVCFAERYVRIPDVLNVYRRRESSITKNKRDALGHARLWMKAFVRAFDDCDKFLESKEIFRNNPDLKYSALDVIAQNTFIQMIPSNRFLTVAKFDKVFREEISKSKNPSAIASFFFNMAYMYGKQIGDYLLEKKRQDTKNNTVSFF